MKCFSGLINSKDVMDGPNKCRFAWELVLFHKIRDWSDGVTWFEFVYNVDRFVADHNPKYDLHLIIANITIFEFNIYNVYHVEEEEYSGVVCDEDHFNC